MKIKSKFILITIVVISLTGCIGALVPVIDLTNDVIATAFDSYAHLNGTWVLI